MSILTRTALLLIAIFASSPVLGSGGLLRDSFETPQLKWAEPRGPGGFRVERHEPSNSEIHSGLASEAFLVTAATGPVYVSYTLAGARVIDELDVHLWVKANRPGIQLFARAVLPRSRDAQGQPIVAVLSGSIYQNAGTWQSLELTRIPALLETVGRGLRVTYGPNVDLREAYIDRLLLNIAGGPGATAIWIDDLDVAGLVETQTVDRPAFRPVSTGMTSHGRPGSTVLEQRAPQIRLNGPNLLVGDIPILVRAVMHCGEPLEYLRGLGFNAICLGMPPTPQIAEAAERLNLWLISPPPIAPQEPPANDSKPPELLGRLYDRVLAWHMGIGLCRENLEETKSRAESIRVRDRAFARPLLGEALTDLHAYSRPLDILLLTRLPLGSSLELPKYLTWLRNQPRLARPGTPFWATIQTEPLIELVEQLRGLSAGRVRGASVQPEQIRLLTHTAIAGGARGLIFESRSRLDARNPATQERSRALQLLNLELALAEPWIASGSYLAVVPGSDPEALAAVFESSQSRLIFPLWSGKGAQLVPGQLAGSNISFVVPGVPESFNAFELSPADLPIPRHRRVAGGTRVTLDEAGLSSIILMTNDPVSAQHVNSRLMATSQTAARIQRDLAASRLQLVSSVDQRLAAQSQVFAKSAEYLGMARSGLAECDRALASGQNQAAYLAAERAIRPLRLIERGHWEAITKPLPSTSISPFLAAFATLPDHASFLAMIGALQFVPVDLVGGQCENLALMEQVGWQHVRYAEPQIKTGADLSMINPRFGRYCLRLWAQPIEPTQAPEVVETPPVWIETPRIHVRLGELLRIRAWVRVAGVAGSVDGLMIIDSIGGQALAERVENTGDWKEFVSYRAATESGPFAMKFALTGLGEAFIDEVSVERLMRPGDLIRPPGPQSTAGMRLAPAISALPESFAPNGGTASAVGSQIGLSITR